MTDRVKVHKTVVVLRLTHEQTKALHQAAGNTMDYEDAVRDVFGDGRTAAAAERAYRLLGQAAGRVLIMEDDN